MFPFVVYEYEDKKNVMTLDGLKCYYNSFSAENSFYNYAFPKSRVSVYFYT